MKKLLIFLLVIGILVGGGYAAFRYVSETGYLTALSQKIFSFLSATVQTPGIQAGGDAPSAQVTPSPEQQPEQPPAEPPETPPQTGPGYDEEGRLVDPDAALHALLYEAASNHREEVEITHLGYTADTLKPEVTRFFFTNPDLFYVDTGYSIYTGDGQTTVRKIKLNYLYSAATVPAKVAEYDGFVSQILSGVPQTGTDFDKVLYLHDYLIQNYAYDHEGLVEEQATGQSIAVRDAYQFFKGGVGVCQAYMLAMIALCQEVDIPCLPVISNEMQHAWNLVQLDGKWYHVDVTWDDAGGEEAPVYPSYISYEYFLLSGEALYSGGGDRKPRYAAWEASERTDSTLYDNATWRGATTPMLKADGSYYCVLYDTVDSKAKIYCGTPVQMQSIKELTGVRWNGTKNGSYYLKAWASLIWWDGSIFLNTNKAFWRYDVQTGTLTTVTDFSSSLENKQIFGVCNVSESGVITYVVAADYRGAFEVRTWQIPTP